MTDLWVKNEVITTAGKMGWLFNSKIWKRIESELRLYNHHQNQTDNKRDWLRICLHSILQHAVRIDLGLYLYNILLRSDSRTYFLSMPMPLRWGPTTNSMCRHFDHSIGMLKDIAGIEQLGCFVCFQTETHEGYEQFLMGFHKVSDSWVGDRDEIVLNSKHLFGISLNDNECASNSTQWASITRDSEDVAFSSVPHGCAQTLKPNRLVVYPCLVAILDDESTTETLDCNIIFTLIVRCLRHQSVLLAVHIHQPVLVNAFRPLMKCPVPRTLARRC